MAASSAACLLALSMGVVHELSEDNFERIVFQPGSHTGAFVKFFAPWCGHCQKMAPDWKKVEKAHRKSTGLLVGSVDCSDGPPQPGGMGGGGRNPLCDKYRAMSLPTLMYFNPPSTKGFVYEGNKTAADLLPFAKSLGSSCSLSVQAECSEEQKGWLEEYGALPVDALKGKASQIMMQSDMAKMQMMMAQMEAQETFGDKSLSEAAKDAKMKGFEGKMKELGEASDTAWEQAGPLRAMRMVLQQKEGGEAALAEMDKFDMMSMMGRGPPGASAAKKVKKTKKKAKKGTAKDEV